MLSHFICVWLFVTLWTVARWAPLSMGFSRQEYWSGLPCPPPVDLPDPGIKPMSFMSPALAGGFFTISATWEAQPLLPHSYRIWSLQPEWKSISLLSTACSSNERGNRQAQNHSYNFHTIHLIIKRVSRKPIKMQKTKILSYKLT